MNLFFTARLWEADHVGFSRRPPLFDIRTAFGTWQLHHLHKDEIVQMAFAAAALAPGVPLPWPHLGSFWLIFDQWRPVKNWRSSIRDWTWSNLGLHGFARFALLHLYFAPLQKDWRDNRLQCSKRQHVGSAQPALYELCHSSCLGLSLKHRQPHIPLHNIYDKTKLKNTDEWTPIHNLRQIFQEERKKERKKR